MEKLIPKITHETDGLLFQPSKDVRLSTCYQVLYFSISDDLSLVALSFYFDYSCILSVLENMMMIITIVSVDIQHKPESPYPQL